MTPNEAVTTLNALFNHQATEIHCVAGELITGTVNDYLSVVSNVVAGGWDSKSPQHQAMAALCELFGGATEVVELHLVAGERAEAVILSQDEEGNHYKVGDEFASERVRSEFVCSHVLEGDE